MRNIFLFVIVLASIVLLATACASSTSETVDEEQAGEHMDDHMEHVDQMDHAMDHMHVDAPEEFASLSNPLAGDDEALAAGETIFETYCVTCHGPEGRGDGPSAAGLDPKPANLADNMMMPTLSDGYLFWRVSKGGGIDPFNSAMPRWEQALSETKRWQVITYVRTLSEQ